MEAAAIALENLTNISDATQDLKQRLNQSKSLLDLTEVIFKCCGWYMHSYYNFVIRVQNQERILRMVNESLRNDGSSKLILDSLMNANYEEPLTQIAKDAVKDYLLE